MVRVKICGITNWEDAAAAVDAGADALGFVMAASPRQVEPAQARAIIDRLPPLVTTVGVLVAEPPASAAAKMNESGCCVAQLHGEWPTGAAAALRTWPIIRAVKVRSAADVEGIDAAGCAAVLLDAYREGLEGGTGASFDWALARDAAVIGKPIILAGGLTRENVAEAIATVRPYAVDVSTGVEAEPGRKDHDRMRRFVEAARGAAERLGDHSRVAG
jgi:phosphoribosylanthranilate isomerase